ncbi:MAG: hypothetical protein HKN13_03440 [Rhodothermales bacterium]|nr:hypothetical protein [Rhodothermales bacterium]
MKNGSQLVVFCSLLVSMTLAGCATTSSTTGKSEALQIAQAAGMKQLRDVSRDRYEEAIRQRPDMDLSNAINVVGVGTKVFNQQTGWSLGAETAALGVLAIFESLPTYVPEADNRLLIWMPQTLARDSEQAAVLMRDTLVSAMQKTLPDYEVKLSRRHFDGTGSGERNYLSIDGPSCTNCELYSLTFFNELTEPRVRTAPQFAGGQSAYVWGMSGTRNSALYGFPGENAGQSRLSPNDRLNILTRLSRELPAWVYLYVAPKEDQSGFPMILHQGRPMLFLDPDR